MREIDSVLAGVHRLAVDTAPIIYFIQQHPRYDSTVTEIFRRIDDGDLEAVTSVITLTEVLVHPIQMGRSDLHRAYFTLLTQSAHLTLTGIDESIAEQASVLRAHYHLRTPDALQIAVAMESECDAFLTNDKKLRMIPHLKVIVLDDIVA